jgi:tetratricopeptide (TPR) repeat protein
MTVSFVCFRNTVCIFITLLLTCAVSAQMSQSPLTASQIIGLQAGGVLSTNLEHEISVRGIRFHMDPEFERQLTRAGAEPAVLTALRQAKVPARPLSPDKDLVEQIASAATLMSGKDYRAAAEVLGKAYNDSFAAPEVSFVMAELLRETQQWGQAARVYSELLKSNPEFPQVHTKLSFVLYRLGATETALTEARVALSINPNDSEAHKNAGLALADMQKHDLSISEYREALRLKPDYAVVHFDLGLLLYSLHSYDDSITEYKKAIALTPLLADAHANLGLALEAKHEMAPALAELREAKRLAPEDVAIRQNLASVLMSVNPHDAIVELREMEKQFPDAELCHVCLGNALVWASDIPGAQAEYHSAERLDPSDPEPHSGLGRIEEDKHDLDGAMGEYQLAERLGPDKARTHEDVARIWLAKKDFARAIDECRQAELLSPGSASIHQLYGRALRAADQLDLAIEEFKASVSLDRKQSEARIDLASSFEKKGDWVSALQEYKRAAMEWSNLLTRAAPGETVMLIGPDAPKEYQSAQARFADHLAELKMAGKQAEASELVHALNAVDNAAGIQDRVEAALQSGQQAFHGQNFPEAELKFKEAVDLSRQLPPGDEDHIFALGRLAATYDMRHNYADSDATLHEQVRVIESAFGSSSPRLAAPLLLLGSLAAGQKNYSVALNYLTRSLEVNEQTFGENSSRTAESLRQMAGLYMRQGDWATAEPFLLRAVKAEENGTNSDPSMVVIPLYGLCALYDLWSKPEKSQPCWHRTTELMEAHLGTQSPLLGDTLRKEAEALHRLGRDQEAVPLQQRVTRLQVAQSN